MRKKPKRWFREISFEEAGERLTETWFNKNADGKKGEKYSVDVRIGKQADMLSLKSNVVKNWDSRLAHIKSTRTALFNSNKADKVRSCPVCGTPSGKSNYRIAVYGARYNQCPTCGHLFVINKPASAVLKRFYSNNKAYSSTYTSEKELKKRVEQIVIPKAKWVIEKYRSHYGKKPRAMLDVGAGGGHFVFACRQMGMDAYGIEINAASRRFCRKNFDFDLERCDFKKDWSRFQGIDIVTFWGVIEHVVDPVSMLKTANKVLTGKNGLVVAEVPRWNSLSTAIQYKFKNSVIRHLDPLGHINCFTDSSLLTAFDISNFVPIAAWYFGMDMYELTTQFFYLLKDKKIIDVFAKYANFFQKTIDSGKLSDGMVLVGKPKNERKK